MAGTGYCRVTPEGDVTPCPYLPTVAGNARGDRDFVEIWQSSPVLTRFRSPGLALGGKCGACRFSRGDAPVCVGCRARAFALEGDELAADPWCLYEPGEDATPDVISAEMAAPTAVTWSEEARTRLGRAPFFIRGRVEQSAEAYVREQGLSEVSTDVLEHLRERAGMGPSRPQAHDPDAPPRRH
jgi:radical SAM protein with 4Fe4S-binding SPASM domain